MAETILSYLLAAELEQAKAMTTVQPRRIESNAQCPKCGKPYGSATIGDCLAFERAPAGTANGHGPIPASVTG